MGPKTIRILWTYGPHPQMAAKAGGHYRPNFQNHRGVTQGDPLLPTIFNVVIETVIQHWVTVVGVSQEGSEQEVPGRSNQALSAIFYANDGLVSLLECACLQGAFDTLTGPFDHVGLRTNKRKTVSMECWPCHTPHSCSM